MGGGGIYLAPDIGVPRPSGGRPAVVSHLAALYGANVRLTLEIQANLRDDFQHNLTENCRTLKFRSSGLEEDKGGERARRTSLKCDRGSGAPRD